MVQPGRLTLGNFFDYITAIKEELKLQNESRMSPEERMMESAKRSIDEMLAKSGADDDEEFIAEEQQEDAGQAAILQLLGVGGTNPAAPAPERVPDSILQQLAGGYGR